MSASKVRSRFTKLAVALASTLVALAAIEVGTRVWMRLRGTPWDAERIRGEFVRQITSLTSRLPTIDPTARPVDESRVAETLHPYLGFDGFAMQNQLRQEIETTRRDDGYDVFVTGGSVSAVFVGAGSERLVELLAAAPEFQGLPIRVWLEGRGAYKQPQPANALAYALTLGVQPELVLLIDGFNDVAIAAQNAVEGAHVLWPWGTNWLVLASDPTSDPRVLDQTIVVREHLDRVIALGSGALDWHAEQSAFAGWLALRWMESVRVDANAATKDWRAALAARRVGATERGPEFAGDADAARRCAVEAWRQGSLSMWSVCRARGIRFLHVLQPTLHDPGSKPLTELERKNGTAVPAWIEGARLGYPLLRTTGAELSERGVPFLDASGIFADVTESVYIDNCHFDDHGNRLLAEAIAQRLLEPPAKDK